MRNAITLVRPHGQPAFEILNDNTVPFAEQLRSFKDAVGGGKSHPKFAEIQIWVSDDGIAKQAKFANPKALKAAQSEANKAANAQAEAEKAEAEAKAAQEAEEKAAAEKAEREAEEARTAAAKAESAKTSKKTPKS